MPGTKSVKDQEMAADLKRRGVKRTIMRCPVCNKIVSINAFQKHIEVHK